MNEQTKQVDLKCDDSACGVYTPATGYIIQGEVKVVFLTLATVTTTIRLRFDGGSTEVIKVTVT